MPLDFHIYDETNISLLEPLNEEAHDWCALHLPSDCQKFAGKYVIEHRIVGDIVRGIYDDGLAVGAADGSDSEPARVLH